MAAVMAAVLAAGTACSAEEGKRSRDGRIAGAAMRVYDPPTRFDGGSAVPVPVVNARAGSEVELPVVLDGAIAYLTDGSGVKAIDVITGRVRWAAAPVGQAVGTAMPAAPVMTSRAGKPVVLAAAPVAVPGVGTTPEHVAIEVRTVDAATGASVWTRQVEVGAEGAAALTEDGVRVVGCDGQIAVVRSGQATYAIAVSDGHLRWKKDAFAAAALAGGLVIGVDPPDAAAHQQVTALVLADGAPAWHAASDSYQLSVQAAGPDLVAVSGLRYADATRVFSLIDAGTGRVRRSRPIDRDVSLTCRYDQVSVVVCSGQAEGAARAEAFVARTGRALWSLPAAGSARVAPTVTALWHGAVYGSTANGPVVVDARTGIDRPGAPGVAPSLVDGYVGVVVDAGGGPVEAYRAVG